MTAWLTVKLFVQCPVTAGRLFSSTAIHKVHTTPPCTCRYSEVRDRSWHQVKPNLSFHLYLPASFAEAVTKIFWQTTKWSDSLWLSVCICELCVPHYVSTCTVCTNVHTHLPGASAPPPLKLSQNMFWSGSSKEWLNQTPSLFLILPSLLTARYTKTPHTFLHEHSTTCTRKHTHLQSGTKLSSRAVTKIQTFTSDSLTAAALLPTVWPNALSLTV